MRSINRESSSLALKAVNPIDLKANPPYILDTELFEKNCGREESITPHAWTEAARNFVRFTGETGVGGDDGSWYKRWDDHFSFLEIWDENFPAILALDIPVATPFIYVPDGTRKSMRRKNNRLSTQNVELGTPPHLLFIDY